QSLRTMRRWRSTASRFLLDRACSSPRCDIEKILHRVPAACQTYQLKFLGLGAALLFGAQQTSAQAMSDAASVFQVGVQAIGVVTRESPAIHGRDLTEGYLTQPVIMMQLDPWRE